MPIESRTLVEKFILLYRWIDWLPYATHDTFVRRLPEAGIAELIKK